MSSGATLHMAVWSHMPNDIFWTHILPRCDIDTRLGFKARAPRVKLPCIDPKLAFELERYLVWRRDGPLWLPICAPALGYNYQIPYWKYGARYRPIIARRWPSANKWTFKPKVYLYVDHSWRGHHYDEETRKDVVWNAPKGTTRVYIEKRDATDDARPHDLEYKPIRIETHVATFFIPPSASTT
jgi:hypothetical protein